MIQTETQDQELTLDMQLESAFLNPFGKPIILASTDGSIFIVATYSDAEIDWKGVQTGGTLIGTWNGNKHPVVSGSFTMVPNAHEDLVKGIENETGMISFFNMKGLERFRYCCPQLAQLDR